MKKELSYQFDYFSENFKRFENDFYKIAKTTTPFIFLTDDMLKTLSNSGKKYFRLTSSQTKTAKNYFFFFREKDLKENSEIILYEYLDYRKE